MHGMVIKRDDKNKVIPRDVLMDSYGWRVWLQSEVDNEMRFSDAMHHYISLANSGNPTQHISGKGHQKGMAPENKCECNDVFCICIDNDNCWGPWCGNVDKHERRSRRMRQDLDGAVGTGMADKSLFMAIQQSINTWKTRVNSMTKIGPLSAEHEFKQSMTTICFAIDWLFAEAYDYDKQYASLTEEAMNYMWHMSNKITDSWMDHWKDNWMDLREKDFADPCDTIYDGADFRQMRKWDKMSSSWTTILEIKVFRLKYNIDTNKINYFLTNLLDVLFWVQGIIETQTDWEKQTLQIVDRFGETYRETYNLARTIKSCLKCKIVLCHGSASGRRPRRTFASKQTLERREGMNEKKKTA